VVAAELFTFKNHDLADDMTPPVTAMFKLTPHAAGKRKRVVVWPKKVVTFVLPESHLILTGTPIAESLAQTVVNFT
jgi:hypothetical protein